MLTKINYYLLHFSLLFTLAAICEDAQVSADVSRDIEQRKSHPEHSKRRKKNNKKRNEHCELDLELVSGFAIPAVIGIVSSISTDGAQAYLTYLNLEDTTITSQPIVAQLYDNVNGTLVVSRTLPADSARPIAWQGYASRDFTKFSVLQSDDAGHIRIRVYTPGTGPDFSLFGTFEVFPSNITYSNVMGGTFSEDGHYVIYGYNDITDPAHPTSTFYVLDATDPSLPVVATTQVAQFAGYLPNVTLFTLLDDEGNKNLYFTFTSNGVFYGQSDATEPPFFSQIFKVDVVKKTITLVAKRELPQYAEVNVLVRKDKKQALIMHGGQCTVNPNAPNIYTVINKGMIGQLPPDYNAIHIFRFTAEEEKLELILEQQSECCTFMAAYPPDNGLSYLLGQGVTIFQTPGDPATLGPGPQEYYSLFRVKDGPTGRVLRPENGPFQDIKAGNTVFSEDGHWMLRTGSFGFLNDDHPRPDSIGIKNVLFFRVTSNKYKPICKI